MFDDALLESRRTHSLGGRRLSLPVAVGLHAAVIATLVGASVWSAGEPPEPVAPMLYPVTFRTAGPPPPIGAENAVHRRENAAPPRPAPSLTLPDQMPDAPIPGSDDAPQAAQAGPPDGAAEPGSEDGVPGGTGKTPGGPEDGLPSTSEILTPGGDVRAPVLLERVEPDYPESARRAHLEGMVILEAVITVSGDVQEIRVLRSVNPLLDEAAVRAVRRWRYRAATLNGRAVPVYLTVTVEFRLPS